MDETQAPAGDNQQVQVPDAGVDAVATQGKSEPSTWRDKLPESLKASKTLSKFASEEALAKSYVDLETRFRTGDVPKPKDDAPPDEWDKFYSKVGRPKQADDYALSAEGYEVDDKFMGEVKAQFHKAGLDQRQAKAVFSYLADKARAEQAQDDAHEQANNKALEQAWGQQRDQKLELARRFIVKNGGEKALAHLERIGAAGDAVVLQLLAAAAEGSGPHRFVDGVTSKGQKPSPYGYMNGGQA